MKAAKWIVTVAVISAVCFTACGKTTENVEKEPEETDSPVTATISPSEPGTVTIAPEQSKELNAADSDGETDAARPKMERTVVYSEDFEQGDGGFTARGTEQVAAVTTMAYEGGGCLAVTGRTETWHGAKLDVGTWFLLSRRFELEAWVKYENGRDTEKIYAKVEQNGSNYLEFGAVTAKRGEWVRITGTFEVPDGTTSAAIYFETEYQAAGSEKKQADLYIDQVTLTQVTIEEASGELPHLADIHRDYFSVGVAVTARELKDEKRVKLIRENFSSITMGNEMKPENILDYAVCSSDPKKYNTEPALNFDKLDIGMKFARENNLPLRGHTLVWHSQTPRWFFTEGYSKEETAPLVSKEVMLARLESYIRQVLTYCQETYPGVVYCWDVVNEAIEPSDGQEKLLRSKDSLWYATIGEEYVEAAFTFARKYADASVRLFYNDYNCYDKVKLFAIYELAEGLYQKGVLDGIGLQSHIGMTFPSKADYQYAITKLGEIGCEIQITELDIALESNTPEDFLKLGTKYKGLMTMYRYLKEQGKANITNITVWGLSDELSWLNKDGRKYPLLFDDYLSPKDAYYGFCLDESVSAY